MTDDADEWRVIHNPITGEVLTFLKRTPEQVVFDLELPPQRLPVAVHSHPGTESFEVLEGTLRLTVAGDVHDLGPGETSTVHDELHGPANVSDRLARVRVTCAELPEFAERGLRGGFGLARYGRMTGGWAAKGHLGVRSTERERPVLHASDATPALGRHDDCPRWNRPVGGEEEDSRELLATGSPPALGSARPSTAPLTSDPPSRPRPTADRGWSPPTPVIRRREARSVPLRNPTGRAGPGAVSQVGG